MSTAQAIRINQAINETEQLLAKELSYMVQHQKADVIASYRAHLTNLRRMLEA